MSKKIVFYDVNPKYFKDHSGDGSGDLKGLISKMDYFKYLGIDALIIPNIFSTQFDVKNQSFKQEDKTFGKIEDLKKVVKLALKQNINLFIELNIGTIKETHAWFKEALNNNNTFKDIVGFKTNKIYDLPKEKQTKYSEKTKSYYIINKTTKEISLNWSNKETIRQFVEVVKFWNKLGISGFVFINFEQIGYTNIEEKLMSLVTLKELRKLYIAIKEINDHIKIIGKTSILDSKTSNIYTTGPTKVFDYTQITKISKFGTSKEYGNDVIGKFSKNKFVKELRNLTYTKNNIVVFGSNESGRITSRWGNEGQYNSESAKSLGLLLLTSGSSSSIYYGDELGATNIGLTYLDDFQDETLNERKRALADKKIKEKKFMDAQILQNPINSKSLMAWNNLKNGGFSNSEKTNIPVSITYKDINVEKQFLEKTSTLNFYKKLISLTKLDAYKKIFTFGKYKISISKFGRGVIKIIRKLDNKQITIFVNLSNKIKTISTSKISGKIQLSTYGHKKYKEIPKILGPYESILILNEIVLKHD